MIRLLITICTVSVCLFNSGIAYCSPDPEFRIPLSEKGFKRLTGKFPGKNTTRTDIYFDLLCDGRFISRYQANPFKPRIKQKETKQEYQFSVIQERETLDVLNTPVGFRLADTQEVKIASNDALLVRADQFLRALSRPNAKLIELGHDVHNTFMAGRYPGKSLIRGWVDKQHCEFIPSGESTKLRRSFQWTTSDGTELEVKLGKTLEVDGEGRDLVFFELEADPASYSPKMDRRRIARELVDYLTDGNGLAPSDISTDQSQMGQYVLTQLKKAGSVNGH